MKKKLSKKEPDLSMSEKGLIPWSTKEFYEVYAKYAEKKMKTGDKPGLLAEVFRKEYPDELEAAAHEHRFRLIRMFIFGYGRQMMKDGFGAPKGEAGLRNELMDVLCTLPYSNVEKGPGYDFLTFSYPQVKAAALKKINAHLN